MRSSAWESTELCCSGSSTMQSMFNTKWFEMGENEVYMWGFRRNWSRAAPPFTEYSKICCCLPAPPFLRAGGYGSYPFFLLVLDGLLKERVAWLPSPAATFKTYSACWLYAILSAVLKTSFMVSTLDSLEMSLQTPFATSRCLSKATIS